jgi:hypothetical protein
MCVCVCVCFCVCASVCFKWFVGWAGRGRQQQLVAHMHHVSLSGLAWHSWQRPVVASRTADCPRNGQRKCAVSARLLCCIWLQACGVQLGGAACCVLARMPVTPNVCANASCDGSCVRMNACPHDSLGCAMLQASCVSHAPGGPHTTAPGAQVCPFRVRPTAGSRCARHALALWRPSSSVACCLFASHAVMRHSSAGCTEDSR